MKRILLDQGLAPSVALLLREEGWDAIHVSEIGLATADDAQILDAARRDGRTCVTLDHDFHANLALTRSEQPSVYFCGFKSSTLLGKRLSCEQSGKFARRS